MALALRSLVLSQSVPYSDTAPPCNFYRYATADAVATVTAAGYFNGARDKLKVNDTIDCMCVMGGTADRVAVILTAVPATGNVTCSINTDASGA